MNPGETWPRPPIDQAERLSEMIARVARESGCTMEHAARVFAGLREQGYTTVTATTPGFEPIARPPRVPLWLRIASRIVNLLKRLGIGADDKGNG